MQLTYLGHASFLIESAAGARIVTDPYPQSVLSHPVVRCDAVTLSHTHFDHCDLTQVQGAPQVIDTPLPTSVGDILVSCVESFHDAANGKKRGPNRIYLFEADGRRVAHLGDLGHLPDTVQQARIGRVDALLCPVGGTYTLDPAQAAEAVRLLRPACVVPMHYRCSGHSFDVLQPADAFAALFPQEDVLLSASDTLTLPAARLVTVLEASPFAKMLKHFREGNRNPLAAPWAAASGLPRESAADAQVVLADENVSMAVSGRTHQYGAPLASL